MALKLLLAASAVVAQGAPASPGGASTNYTFVNNGTDFFGSNASSKITDTPVCNAILLWSFATGDAVKSSPAVGADGTVYVGSLDHKLYAIKAPCDRPSPCVLAEERLCGATWNSSLECTLCCGEHAQALQQVCFPLTLLLASFSCIGLIMARVDGTVCAG